MGRPLSVSIDEENPAVRLPEDEDDVTNAADTETEQEEALAVAQAELIGDL